MILVFPNPTDSSSIMFFGLIFFRDRVWAMFFVTRASSLLFCLSPFAFSLSCVFWEPARCSSELFALPSWSVLCAPAAAAAAPFPHPPKLTLALAAKSLGWKSHHQTGTAGVLQVQRRLRFYQIYPQGHQNALCLSRSLYCHSGWVIPHVLLSPLGGSSLGIFWECFFLRPGVQLEGLVKHSSLFHFVLLWAIKLPISLKIKLRVHRLIDGLKAASCDISSWPV